jgi:hypothetical protein
MRVHPQVCYYVLFMHAHTNVNTCIHLCVQCHGHACSPPGIYACAHESVTATCLPTPLFTSPCTRYSTHQIQTRKHTHEQRVSPCKAYSFSRTRRQHTQKVTLDEFLAHAQNSHTHTHTNSVSVHAKHFLSHAKHILSRQSIFLLTHANTTDTEGLSG